MSVRKLTYLLLWLTAMCLSAQTYYVVCNNYSYNGGSSTSYTVGPERVRSYTDMVYPGAVRPTYSTRSMTLQGYFRIGEWVDQDGNRAPFSHNSRQDVMTPPDVTGGHARDSVLIVVGMNCEYFLVDNLGSGSMGPSSAAEQEAQFKKISQAMVRMDADIYGMCEIGQGQGSLKKCAEYLTQQLGRKFAYINDGLSGSGTYTKSGILYCSDRVTPVGQYKMNNTAVSYRKVMQCFEIKMGRPHAGERFIFSMNHFKAKSGTGSGNDADQGDGQGQFNSTRTREAESVINLYSSYHTTVNEQDLLVMGDLNAYAKEDPIQKFTRAGYTDLHRYFHADTSYSYVGYGQTGYLDHALANPYLLKQVVGMAAWHINSDECDHFTYNGSLNSRLSDNEAMFRYSDHDPILVGLLLNQELSTKDTTLTQEEKRYCIYSLQGHLLYQDLQEEQLAGLSLPDGWYVENAYGQKSKLIERRKLYVINGKWYREK